MLTSWTVENFKSIGRQLVLPLSPITALVGANSSGKSSIIQSILLIKQTLQYATADRPIALNGPLLKLGTFDDVRNVRSEGKGVRIGWHYSESYMPSTSESFFRPRSTVYAPWRDLISNIECLTEFGIDPSATSELAKLQPSLFSTSLTTKSGEDSDHSALLEIGRMFGQSQPPSLPTAPPQFSMSARPQQSRLYHVTDIDIETRAALLEDHPKGEIEGALVRHFLPLTIAVQFDSSLRRATQIADAICSLRKSIRFQREFSSLPAPAKLLTLLRGWVRANREFLSQHRSFNEEETFSNSPTIGSVLDSLLELQRRSRTSRSISFPSLQELQPKIIEVLSADEAGKTEVDFERPRLIYEAANHTREYFEHYVRYLGPLRDEPKPLYPLEALGNPTDVGYRGEHTAAVLHLNQYRSINYFGSDKFTDKSIEIGPPGTEALLRDALVDWLSYMGVIDGILTDDRGKIGHEMQVRTPGIAKFHDLTNVGVGVSQVLPIILMALLAPTGSLLIFEQPELHLHPRVQTRLADFFISMAISGKQCLLETHSEYLIHRLRRRIAEAPGDQLTSLSKLYFVERSGDSTSCKPVDITKYGAVLDWPSDFFDQSQMETENILSAASIKRAEEQKKRQEQ